MLNNLSKSTKHGILLFISEWIYYWVLVGVSYYIIRILKLDVENFLTSLLVIHPILNILAFLSLQKGLREESKPFNFFVTVIFLLGTLAVFGVYAYILVFYPGPM